MHLPQQSRLASVVMKIYASSKPNHLTLFAGLRRISQMVATGVVDALRSRDCSSPKNSRGSWSTPWRQCTDAARVHRRSRGCATAAVPSFANATCTALLWSLVLSWFCDQQHATRHLLYIQGGRGQARVADSRYLFGGLLCFQHADQTKPFSSRKHEGRCIFTWLMRLCFDRCCSCLPSHTDCTIFSGTRAW